MLRRIVIVCILLFFCLGTFCFFRHQNKFIQVESFTLKRGEFISTVSSGSIATVVSEREIDICSELTGRIEDIFIREGQKVKKGQTLVILDDKKFRLMVEEKRIRELKLRNDLERYKTLYHQGIVPEIELNERQFSHQIALNDLQRAEADLEKTHVLSPFCGLVSKIYLEEGEVVRGSGIYEQPILRLIDHHRLQISVGIDETDISQIEIGQEAEIRYEAMPDRVFKGRVNKIADSVTIGDLIGQTFQVIIELQEIRDWIRPGMTADVLIVVARKNDVLVVPVEAVIAKNGEHFVYVLDNERALLTKVSRGLTNLESVEITSGIEEGNKIIISDLDKIRNRDRVRDKGKKRK